jgi:hypothetical protein
MTKFSAILTDFFQDILQGVFQPGLCHICGKAARCYPDPGSGLAYCLVCLEATISETTPPPTAYRRAA